MKFFPVQPGISLLSPLFLIGCLFSYVSPLKAQMALPVITTIGGGGSPATGNGDGGSALSARLAEPVAVAVDGMGNVYLAERYTFTVRKIAASGVITTIAGNGSQMFNGDGIPATSAAIDVRGIAVDAAGNLYIADGSNKRVRKVSTNGSISTIAKAGLGFTTRVAVSATGSVYVLDGVQVFRISGAGQLQLVAGNNEFGTGGDGGPATQAQLQNPTAIAFDRSGNLNIVSGERLRRVDANGIISTVAGGGPFKIDPVATSYRWMFPTGVAFDSRNNIYVAGGNNVVRIVSPQGIASDAAGHIVNDFGDVVGAPFGFSGDGAVATEALLHEPEAVAVDQQDNLYIADTRNNRIRKVSPGVPTPHTPVGVNAFAPYKTYAVGSYGTSMAVADVTGDGRDDALMLTGDWGPQFPEPTNDQKLNLFIQNSDGTLAAPVKYSVAGDAGPTYTSGPATGDLNRDGRADVIVGVRNGIRIYLGQPGGLGQSTQYIAIPHAQVTQGLVIIDINGDGNLDVVTLSGGREEGGSYPDDLYGFIYYYGNGAGGISSRQFIPMEDGRNLGKLQVHDLNGDGLLDLMGNWSEISQVVDGTSPYRQGVAWKLHLPGSGFGQTRYAHIDHAWNSSHSFTVGDFNGDGRKDILMAAEANMPNAYYALLPQDASGNFLESKRWSAYELPNEVRAADMNGDGNDDLIVVHSGWKAIGFHAGTGAGLDDEIKYFTDESSNQIFPALAIGDLNGDGCKDIAMGDRNFGLVVMTGIRCFVAQRDSQPRVPPKPPQSSKPASPPVANNSPATEDGPAPRKFFGNAYNISALGFFIAVCFGLFGFAYGYRRYLWYLRFFR